MTKQNFDMQKQVQSMQEEIEDLREQVTIKRRAPVSKKRASDARLTQALNQFKTEEEEMFTQMRLMFAAQRNWELLTSEAGKGTRFKVSLDRQRYFIVQI